MPLQGPNKHIGTAAIEYNNAQTTKYGALLLTPAASGNDIVLAAEYKKKTTRAALDSIQTELKGLFAPFPGLAQLQEAMDKRQDYDEKQYEALLEKAKKQSPQLIEALHKKRQLEKELETSGETVFARYDERVAYDEANAPFAMLKFEEKAACVPADGIETLMLVRRDLLSAMEQSAGDVYHPSDLTRTDFTGEYTYHKLLDDV